MARDTSPSSSEDEAESPAPEPVTESRNKVTRFDCPADFVSFCHVPCSSTLAKSLKSSKKELWLIKAPASFEPECLRGVRVPLSGLQTLPVPGGGGQQAYSVLASGHAPPDLHLLTADRPPLDGVLAAPAFSGQLNLFESPAGAGGGGARSVPAPPAPSIPAGLRQRFQPFGSGTPPVVKRSVEEEEGLKRKKKKKKEKRVKAEQVEEVKLEPDQEEPPLPEEGVPGEKRKKKKRKKDRERDEEEEEEETSVKVEEVSVKSEPMDVSFGEEAENSGKKKKKKKKSKSHDD